MSPRPLVPSTGPGRALAAAVLLVVAGALLTTAILTAGGSGPGSRPAAAGSPSAPSASTDPGTAERAALARRRPGDPFAQGPADAPVVLIEYADFQCPFCRQFALTTEKQLVRQYVDTGRLRIEWRDFPIFGPESEQAARAAWAAGRQGRFWPYYRTLFEHASERRNSGAFSEDNLVAMARAAGIANLTKFRADYGSDAARQAVEHDSQEGQALGIPSTPAFLVNGVPILCAQPLDQFRQAIDQALKTAPAGASGAGR